MTKVSFFRRDSSFVKVECDGHTDYGVKGEDIVCAALSSIVQTAALGLLQAAGINAVLKKQSKRGYFSITLPARLTPAERHDADIILNTLYLGVSDLYSEYSDFIEMEVI